LDGLQRTEHTGGLFSVQKYGAQQKTDQWHSDAGNGLKPDGSKIVGNDPHDTDKEIGPSFVVQWIDHIVEVFGPKAVQYYEMDNEPQLWSETHRDVHPNPVTLDELWNRTSMYASAIKAKYPNVKLMGPVPWGWCAYYFSMADGCSAGSDHASHGGLALLEWYIKQIADYKQKTGVQLIDYIDFHYYPQENGVLSSQEDPATASLRLRTPRGLWDPTYIDESWINKPIAIIPAIRQWIAKYNVPLGITVSEYTWGDDDIITGALAQVIVLGIYAREGVDLAMRWVVPNSNTKTEQGYRIYSNYDGAGAFISGSVLNTTSSQEDSVTAFAFQGTKTFIILVNKSTATASASVNLGGIGTRDTTGVVYSFGRDKPTLAQTAKVQITGGKLSIDLPPWSATLITY